MLYHSYCHVYIQANRCIVRPPPLVRKQLVTNCRYDRRKSLNNVADRRRHGGRKPGQLLDPDEFAHANETVVADRARVLRACTQGQLDLRMCIFMFTEQPQLLSLNTKQLASRIFALSKALGLSAADIGEVVTRCPALLDVLPLRLRSYLQSLSAACGITTPQALYMVASDLDMLDTPALRVRQYLEGLSKLLQAPVALCAELAWQCPYLLRVEPAALQVRWHSLQAVLSCSPAALQGLLAKEPRLLMPSSATLVQNHADILETLNITSSTLNRWVAAAPMLLLVPATQLHKRLAAISTVLREEASALLAMLAERAAPQPQTQPTPAAAAGPILSSEGAGDVSRTSKGPCASQPASSNGSGSGDLSHSSSSSSSHCLHWASVADNPVQLLAYVSKDPRVLLLSPKEVRQKLGHISIEMGLGLWAVAWLLMSHPSYMAMEAGLATRWMEDVRHLTDITQLQAKRLVACPQVFLTMSPEDVMANLHTLSHTLNVGAQAFVPGFTPNMVAAIAADEPLLLVQHPATAAAAYRQLQRLVPEQPLQQQLVCAVPQLLLQGPQLMQVMQEIANALSISCPQLAVILVKDPGFWSLLVPRHTWPCCPSWQQQQQQAAVGGQVSTAAAARIQLSAAAAAAGATMSALVYCGLRSPEFMQAAVVLHPGLLRLQPEAALQHVQTLQQRISRCSSWQQQLQDSLSPEQLGKALTRAYSWDILLAFLISVGWSSSVGLGDVINMTRKEFNSCFGAEFYQWNARLLQQRMHAQGVPWLQQQQQLQSMYRTHQLMSLQGRHQQQLPQAGHQQQQEGQQEAEQQQYQPYQQQEVEQQQAGQQQYQPYQQQQVEAPDNQVDGFVQAMQARLGSRLPASSDGPPCANGSSSSSSSSHVAAAIGGTDDGIPATYGLDNMQQGLQDLVLEGSEGDVYYDDMLVPGMSSSSSSSSSADYGDVEEQVQDWDMAQGALQQQDMTNQVSMRGFDSWQPMRPQQQGLQEVGAAAYQQQQVPMQQQLPGQQYDGQAGRNSKRPGNRLVWSVHRSEQATAAAQLSGWELYGTWLGCLIQPAEVAAASAAASAAAGHAQASAGVGQGSQAAVAHTGGVSAGDGAAVVVEGSDSVGTAV